MQSPLQVSPSIDLNASPARHLGAAFRLSSSRNQGMSLIELIAVTAIMVLMIGILAPSVGSFGKANALTAEGNSVSSLLGLARQHALSKNSYTAFVMNDDPSSDGYRRSFSVWQLTVPPDGSDPVDTDWKQISKWETLKEGIIVDTPTATDWQSIARSPELPTTKMKYGGSAVSDVLYQIFSPSGSILADSPGNIDLVEGHATGGSVTYTRPDNGKAANIYKITIVPSTGRAKIARN